MESYISQHCHCAEAVLIFLWQHGSFTPTSRVEEVCTLEAKICPDGQSVARTGPNCQFPACPDVVTAPTEAVISNVQLSVGEKAEISGVVVTLDKVLQDSRCPRDVTCIQAGAVTVTVTLLDSTHRESVDLVSNTPYTFGGNTISIVAVSPDRLSKHVILSSQYKITFHVSK